MFVQQNNANGVKKKTKVDIINYQNKIRVI